jgi:two-component system nitrogen regulation sensor histidine kinase GlnL
MRTPRRFRSRGASGQAGGALTAAGAAAMLAHEIKNPLSGIRGAAQLLEANVDAEAQSLTRLIRDEVDRVDRSDRPDGEFHRYPTARTGPQNIHAILEHARAVAIRGFGDNIVFESLMIHRCRRSGPSGLARPGAHQSTEECAEAMGEKGGTVTLTTAYRHGIRISPARRRAPIAADRGVRDR